MSREQQSITTQAAVVVGIAALGAVLGTGAEWMHLQAGVWALPAEETFPLWIAGIYFPALLLLLLGLRLLERFTGAAEAPPEDEGKKGEFGGELLLVVLLFAVPMIWPLHEFWLTAGLLIFLTLRLVFLRQPGDLLVSGDLLLCGALMLGSALLESALLAAGLYRYAGASLLALPVWVPLLWAALGLSFRRLARAL